jgi:hypothetical protein
VHNRGTYSCNGKITLLGGAAASAILVLGFGAQADAKPTKHHHKAAAAAPTHDLAAEIEALRARIDSDEAARAQDQAQLQAAQADAASARADAQALRAQVAQTIQTLPGVVNADVAAATPKPNWSGSTKVGATVYADLSNVTQVPSPNSKNGTGADIKRAYLTVDHTFNDVWSASVTADFAPNGIDSQPVGTPPAAGVQGSEVLKKAFIQAKVFGDQLVVRGGTADMPWIPFVEDVYGYRFVEKTVTDWDKIGNSADTGVFAGGKLFNGLVGYSFAAVDGAGYKNPVRSEGMDYEGRVNLNWNGFVAAMKARKARITRTRRR